MVNNAIVGRIVHSGLIGTVEWAIVERYVQGGDANHVVLERLWVTLTDGTTWAVKVIE